MTVRNPFLSIVPRKTEKLIGVSQKRIVDLAVGISRGKSIVLVSGDYGSGKSLIRDKIESVLLSNTKVEKWMFSTDLANQIRSLPVEEAFESERISRRQIVVFIDRFELSDVVDDNKLLKILELIVEISKSGASFVIFVNPKTIMRMFELSAPFKNASKIYKINPLTYPETKELVISRLNEIRLKKSDSLEPFTENELNDIWKKSNGNPRMILLILANLYDIKKQVL